MSCRKCGSEISMGVCSKCGYTPVGRPRGRPKFHEGLTTALISAEDRRVYAEIALDPIMVKDLSIVTNEQYAPIRELHMERAGEILDQKRANEVARRKDGILWKFEQIQTRGYPITPAGNHISLIGLKTKVGNLQSSKFADKVRRLWVEAITFAKSLNFDTQVVTAQTEAKAREKFGTGRPIEKILDEIATDKEIVRDALPILEAGLAIIDARIAVLKDGEMQAIPLIKLANEIAMKGNRLMEKIKPLMEPFTRAYRWENDKNENKAVKKLHPLLKKFRELETKNAKILQRINALQVTVHLVGFPTLFIPARLKDLLI